MSIGETSAQMTNMFSKFRDVGGSKLLKILESYPELSAEWLLRGEGEMIKGENSKQYSLKELTEEIAAAENNVPYKDKFKPVAEETECNWLLELYAIYKPGSVLSKGAMVELLNAENRVKTLENELKLKDTIIELLRK